MTITGAGPGIMAAGNEGAGRDDSFGLNISLPFEAAANEFIAGDPKLINFNYFFTRKLSFVKEADAAVGLPGGFGTMDEVFEALTLIQTGKAAIYPIVLLDAEGGKYWKFWKQFIDEHLARLGMISENDFRALQGDRPGGGGRGGGGGFLPGVSLLPLRGGQDHHPARFRPHGGGGGGPQRAVWRDRESGAIVQQEALEEEEDEPELSSLPRLVFRHRRRDFGRLRKLIDAVNDSPVAASMRVAG